MAYLLGIDTGGTYTDAVLVDETFNVLATAKSLTTKHDLTLGIGAVIEKILTHASDDIGLVSLSTTLATNAIVEGQGNAIALLLLGYERNALERSGLRDALGADPVVFIDGGHNAAGIEQTPLDLTAAYQAVQRHAPNVSAFAVSGYFAVRNPAHELAVRDLVQNLCNLPVSCGHQLSSALDAPRRALTAALNARLISLLSQLINAVKTKLAEHGIDAPLMVVKGDGSLIRAEAALECPVETILSGPAASVVGARQLSGLDNAIVADMGGTTTDIAVLNQGRPMLNRDGASVGGWRTMVEAVQVHTFGLGGDSEVNLDDAGKIEIGPRRMIPLSLLAQEYPACLERLREQSSAPAHRYDGRFALRLRTAPSTLSYAQKTVWTALAQGPLALQDLLIDHTLELPLNRLAARGLVALSSFTPSDAAHVLGQQSSWSQEAAQLGANLLRRWAEHSTKRAWPDDQAFCRHLIDRVLLQTGRCLVTSVLAEQRSEILQTLPALQRDFVDTALADDDESAQNSQNLLGVTLTLRRPLVAIGAPVSIYYPAVAKRLHTDLCIPEHAAIANALGAVASGVMQRIVAHITPLSDSAFRVHAPNGIATFATLDDAVDHANAEVVRLAREQAQHAGAIEVQVKTRRVDNAVRDASGHEVFFESEITATAFGRPRVAHTNTS